MSPTPPQAVITARRHFLEDRTVSEDLVRLPILRSWVRCAGLAYGQKIETAARTGGCPQLTWPYWLSFCYRHRFLWKVSECIDRVLERLPFRPGLGKLVLAWARGLLDLKPSEMWGSP
jgi:hypothetical protein